MSHVWAFYRRSTDKQELSISDQRRECQAFAAAHGWEIVREFIPSKGYASGLTIDRDSTFLEMIRMAEAGGHGIQNLLVYDTSRFGRLAAKRKIFWEEYLSVRGGIKVVYVKNNFNDDSIGGVITQVVAHDGDNAYSRKLSEVTLRGAKSHAALGHSTGGQAPYGYDRLLVDERGTPVRVLKRGEWKSTKLERVVWTPSPTGRQIVIEIFQAYTAGRGLGDIANGLNERGITAPRGRYWSKCQIHHLLRNRAYLGERAYNKRSYKGYRRGEKGSLFNPKDAWILKTDSHEPIIEKELFEKAQALMPKWKERVGGVLRNSYLLSGLCFCEHCQYRMVGTPRQNGKGYKLHTYVCGGYQRFGRSVCQSFYLRAEALEKTALQAIHDQFSDPRWKQDLERVLARMVEDQFGNGAELRVGDLKRQLATAEFEIHNIVEAVKCGQFSPALAAALQALENRKAALERDLKEAQERLGASVTPQGLMHQIMEYAGEFDTLWGKQGTPEEQKRFLKQYIHHITVGRAADHINAAVGLYKIPLAFPQIKTPVKMSLSATSTEVYCGGRI